MRDASKEPHVNGFFASLNEDFAKVGCAPTNIVDVDPSAWCHKVTSCLLATFYDDRKLGQDLVWKGVCFRDEIKERAH